MPPNKPGSKSWEDLKLIFAALSVTTTLGLWNVFAANNEKNTVALQPVASQPTASQPLPTPTLVAQPVFHGKILLGGRPPSQPVVVASNSTSNSKRPHTSGSASNTTGQTQAQAPAPVTTTRTS